MDVELGAAVVDWHVTALARIFVVGEELGHGIFECEASLHEETDFAVLHEADVFN